MKMYTRVVKISHRWYEQHVWQSRKNMICEDIIADVFFIDDCKVILFRN